MFKIFKVNSVQNKAAWLNQRNKEKNNLAYTL